MEGGLEETELQALPDGLLPAMQTLLDAVMEAFAAPPPGEAGGALGDLFRMTLGFVAAADGDPENYAPCCAGGRERNGP